MLEFLIEISYNNKCSKVSILDMSQYQNGFSSCYSSQKIFSIESGPWGFNGGGEGFFMLDVVDTFSTKIFLVLVTDVAATKPFLPPTTKTNCSEFSLCLVDGHLVSLFCTHVLK